jgi:hypothetical protein
MVMRDVRASKQWSRIGGAFAELAGILRRHDGEHARQSRCGRGVDRQDSAFRDCRADDIAIGRVRRDVVALVSVRRAAGRLQRSIDPVYRLSDDLELVDWICGCGRVEFHGSALASARMAPSVRSAN